MSGPSILFVVDAGPEVGGGHVMRSLTLAGALEAEGASCRFVSPPEVAAILAAFAPGTAQVDTASPLPDDLASAVRPERFDAIVFDHYGLSEPDHSAMAQGKPTLVIDDLRRPAAGRGPGAEDRGPARRAEDYNGLTADGARLLLGPQYAPVRPEFAALRDTALAWRGEPVTRVLVSLGLTDVDGITARVVERLRPKVGEVGLDIVLGAEAPSLASLTKIARRDTRIILQHRQPAHGEGLTAEADIAVGAAGSSTWAALRARPADPDGGAGREPAGRRRDPRRARGRPGGRRRRRRFRSAVRPRPEAAHHRRGSPPPARRRQRRALRRPGRAPRR